ncbi:MAG: RluA family pseudouridine synthase [Bacteroidales bacterium]|nr:RluA family pseudouridine synthase [Bacteroidales bacterium]
MEDLKGNTEFEETQEMYEHYRYEVDKGQSIVRIDKYLMNLIEGATRTKVQQAAKAGNVLVNDLPVKQNYKVKPLDVISVVLPNPPRELEILPEDIPLDIVYEDDDLLIVNKKPGMVVHPAYGNFTGTLLNALLFHFHGMDVENSKNPANPLLVHRIDKNTSGLLLVAKNEYAQTFLARQFFDHSIERKYIALAWGDIKDDEGTVRGHVGRSQKDRKVMTVYPEGDHGKHAVTHYRVLDRLGYVSVIECQLETGRTHQIRAHMKWIGYPLFADKEYGGDQILKGTTFTKYKQFVTNCFKICPRQALHARSIGFIHPTSRKNVHFDSELPEDMEMLITKWNDYLGHPSEE